MSLQLIAQGGDPTIISTRTDMYDGSDNAKANAYYDKAVNLADSKKYKASTKLYIKAIKEDPNFIEAYDNLGRVYRVMGDYDKAIYYYKKSIELFPKGNMAHQNLAVVYGIQKNYKGAIEEYEFMVQNDPENVEGYFGLANSYMMLSKFDNALENAEVALDIYKNEQSQHLADGYYMVGLISYFNEDDDKAKENLSLAKEHGMVLNSKLEKKYFSLDVDLNKKEDYKNSEDKFIESYDWLLATNYGEQSAKREELNKFVIEWIMGSPTVTIELNENILSYGDCGDCLVIFMGGWSKYAIESQKYDDIFGGNLAGTKAVLKFYKKNKDALGKNKEIEKLIKLDEAGELETYIKNNI